MEGSRRQPLGVELVRRGIVSEKEVNDALEYQKNHRNMKLGEILKNTSSCDKELLIEQIGDIIGEKGILINANDVEVTFSEIKSNYGHDAFLLERGQLNYLLSKFLSDNIVADLMTSDVTTIKEEDSVKKAATLMLEKNVTHLPVVTDDNKLIGILTSWDLSKSIASNSDNLIDIMTKTVKFCHSSDSIENISKMMRKYDISCLPVVDENFVVEGLITTDQINNRLS